MFWAISFTAGGIRPKSLLIQSGLAQRAGHPEGSLKLLHGSLCDIKCADPVCSYRERNNFEDPFHPSIAITSEDDIKIFPAATETVRPYIPLTLSPAMLSRVGPEVQVRCNFLKVAYS